MSKKTLSNTLSITITQQDFTNTVGARQIILPRYVEQEKASALLFLSHQVFSLPEILLKTVTLNTFYATGIMDVYTVAHHIYNLCQNDNLQSLLACGNTSAVTLIKCVNHNGSTINHMSFASKYANLENPNKFPIMDDLVVDIFSRLRRQHFFKKNTHFSKSALKADYALFKNVYDEFIFLSGMGSLYNAAGNHLNYRDIDHYLWTTKKVQYALQGKNSAKVQLTAPVISLIQANPIYIYG